MCLDDDIQEVCYTHHPQFLLHTKDPPSIPSQSSILHQFDGTTMVSDSMIDLYYGPSTLFAAICLITANVW
jgi:hypothetical protein